MLPFITLLLDDCPNYRKKRKGYEDDDYVSKKSKHEEVCSPKVSIILIVHSNMTVLLRFYSSRVQALYMYVCVKKYIYIKHSYFFASSFMYMVHY